MRTIVELLEFLKQEIIEEKECFNGMCCSIHILYLTNTIDCVEEKILEHYLEENSPIKKGTKDFWWLKGDKQPRLKWLDEQIQKLQNGKENK